MSDAYSTHASTALPNPQPHPHDEDDNSESLIDMLQAMKQQPSNEEVQQNGCRKLSQLSRRMPQVSRTIHDKTDNYDDDDNDADDNDESTDDSDDNVEIITCYSLDFNLEDHEIIIANNGIEIML